LGEVFGISIGDEGLCLVTQSELRVPKERVVGGGDEPTSHLKDSVGGSGPDASGQFLSLRFLFR
jgi:hypothetical protein